MTNKPKSSILEIYLGKTLIGYLTHTQDGKNTFTFDENYIDQGPDKPLLGLYFKEENQLIKPYSSRGNILPPFFSNLLPEGDFRNFIIQQLGLKVSDEFLLFKTLSQDCPGNIIVKGIDNDISPEISQKKLMRSQMKSKELFRFSLAGVQLKFSVFSENGRFTFNHFTEPGNMIIKMPSLCTLFYRKMNIP